MGSLSTRLHRRLVFLATLAVLPAIAVMTYDQTIDRRDARARTLDADLGLTRFAAGQQASIFNGADRLLQTLAQFPGLGNDVEGCNALLMAMLRGHPGYINLSFINPDGTIVCSSNPDSLGLWLGDRAWFQRVMRDATTIAGEFEIGRTTGAQNIVVARPLFGSTGAIERVVGGAIELGQLSRLASTVTLPAGGTLTLFDRSLTILARYPDSARWVGQRVPLEALPLPASPGSVQTRQAVGIDGVRRQYVTVPVETGFDTGLYVTVGSDPAVTFAAADRLRRQQFALVGLVGLIAIGIGVVGGHMYVLRPVAALAGVTKRIADGDFSARADLTAGALGFSELGEAVNSMAGALETRQRDREKFEEQLQASEARYRLLFEQNPQPMWVYDTATMQFLEVNDAAIAKYGYSRDEFLAMRLPDIRPADEVSRLVESVADAPAGLSGTSQWRHRLKSGRVIDVEIISHAVTFRGKAARLVLSHDTTERLRIERQLRETEERMRFALHASQVGVWEVNLQTNGTYWSETCEALHGLAPGAFAGTLDAFLDRIHPDDRPAVYEGMNSAIRDRREAELEYRTVWPDGTERQIASTGRFSYDETGAPIRGAGVATDITERRMLEDQYRHSQKMEAVGQLAGGIAHDFNNMLTAIIGNAEFVNEALPEGDPRRADVEEIERAAHRAADLTHQLLAFSRKQMLAPRVLHLGDIISQVSPMLRRLIGEAIDLKTVVGDRQRVKADAGQIEQVLVNLAVNARDAMSSGGRLTIETSDVVLDEAYAREHPTVRPGPHVMLAVSDTGHGMDAATQKRVFEPFFTTKPNGQGTGLGLATVYGIVKQSGGYIWLYSEVGRGTTFKVYLPQTDEIEAAMQPGGADPRKLRGDERILLIEDEDVVREFAYKVLCRYGYVVYSVLNCTQALAFAAAHHGTIDIVLSDVVLPDMSGPQAVSQLQQRHPESKVLFMSGYTDNAAVHHGVLDAEMPFLQKPFSGETLVQRVRDVLDGQVM
jgi:two-component system cell cycle sensor histidine kinase/response regulator CckA